LKEVLFMALPIISRSRFAWSEVVADWPFSIRFAYLIRRFNYSGYLTAIIAALSSIPIYYFFHSITQHGEWIFALAVIAVSARWGIGPGLVTALLVAIGYSLLASDPFSHNGVVTDTLIWLSFYAIAVFIVGTLVRHREAALVARARMADELEKTSETTLIALTRALDARDQDTEGHSERVADLALEIGHAMGLEESVLRQLRLAALLHDIGKIGITGAHLYPVNYKAKPGKRMMIHRQNCAWRNEQNDAYALNVPGIQLLVS
jgi:hypothetical protein